MTAVVRKLSRWAAPLLGGLVGLVAFQLSLDFSFVDPRNFGWLLLGGIDSSVHFVGWHMFRHEAWTSPLGAIRTFGHPVGTSVALTDSIPILAVLFKGLNPVLPTDFQYIGGWLLCCFILQGAFAALLVGTVTPRLTLRVLGAALFVISPLLVQQPTHSALTSHWLIVAGLWLYFTDDGRHHGAAVWRWALLVVIASGTHPYLAAMVLALSVAAFGRAALVAPSRALTNAVLPISMLLVVALTVMWQAGYFVVTSSGDLQAAGVGYLSMNLLAPLMPRSSSSLFGPGPFLFATDGQYEGYAYVGAGMLFLVGALLVIYRPSLRAVRGASAAHLPLVVVFVGLTILALSPRVTLGTRTLFEYDARWWGPLTLFRASGRLSWPVYYGLMFGIITVVVRRASHRVALSLLALAVLVQAIDISSFYREGKAWSALRLDEPLKNSFWQAAPPHYRHLILDPTNICSPGREALDYRFFAILAGRSGMTINAGYAARYDINKLASYCAALARDLREGNVADDALYVTLPELAPAFVGRAKKPLACTKVDGFAACFTAASYQRWQTAYDVTRMLLPPASDLRAFRDVLEAEYRHRLHRPAAQPTATADDRLATVTSYLAYRAAGCGHDEAADKILGQMRGDVPLRLCGTHRLDAGPLPPPNEALDVLRRVEAAATGKSADSATHVDLEGEAVWVQEYVQQRLAGSDHAHAANAVIGRIRQIAP